MKLAENMLLKYLNGKVIRVLYINHLSSIIYVIECTNNNWPYPIKMDELLSLEKNHEITILNEDSYCKAVLEEELSEAEKSKRDYAWEIIRYLLKQVEDEEHVYVSKYRKKAIKSTLITFKVSYNTVKSYLLKYWKGGKTLNSLVPNFFHCGAKGKERTVSDKKLGRPRLKDISQGVNVDEEIRKIFRIGLNRYYYNERQNSLRTVYELILKNFFTSEQVEQDGVKIPILFDSSKLPTYRQFLYWFSKLNNEKTEVIKRDGTRVFYQKYRTIIGDSTQDASLGPGSLFQIDSTVFDIYLVSSINRDLIVGRPILFLVIDAYSRMIVGINVSFESLNSYAGAMVALANSMTSKKNFCANYGIEIRDEDWVYCVPSRILADRGELVGQQIENAIQNLGISIQNSPPYRADYKGIIEQAFHQMNLKIKPFTDGTVKNGKSKIERGEQDYRLKANLTIEEFTKIIIKCAIFHNNHHVLSGYIMDEMMIEEEVEKIPCKIWKHGLENKKGQLRVLPEDVIKTYLYPADFASVTAKGVAYKKLLYASEYTLKNGWFQRARMSGGSWRVKICFNPLDMTHIYVFNEDGNGLHKLTLLEHLAKFSKKGIEEIDQITKFEQEMERKSKERELQEKMKLFNDIEQIVQEGREKTNSQRDVSKSKTKKLKGIKENQKQERQFQRKAIRNELLKSSVTENDYHTIDDSDDYLQLFRQLQQGLALGDEDDK